MAKRRGNIRIKESKNAFQKKIDRAIAEEINNILRKNASKVESRVRGLIPGWIRSSPEIQSLESEGSQGSLNAQFGLRPGQAATATSEIIGAVIGSVQVKINPVTSKVLKKQTIVEFSVQPLSFDNLLGLPSAIVIQATNGKVLPWLDWLLNLGNTVVVGGYTYKPEVGGRSGGGTMSPGVGWRVPPQYAGTPDDNFITRALANREKEITPILQGILNV